ncbi:MAG: NUDIX hydrolase [Marinilabiliaceae bacterium]|nr:NUDIX hydrolase [Marinilabiliaceae bacterium]
MTKPGDVIKYCPKCGNNDFIFDGDRQFRCDGCGFIFYINSSAAVAAIIVNDLGQILLTIRAFEPKQGFFDLPGGFVDPMESAEDAIKREIKEELNLDVVSCQYLVSFPNEYIFSNFSVYTTDLGFIVEVKSFDTVLANDDITGYVFVDPDLINWTKISSESIALIIRYYFAKKVY